MTAAPTGTVGRGLSLRVAGWFSLLTGLNAVVCALVYEAGYGASTFLFGPADRFADLLKVGLSYKAFLAGKVSAAKLALWPELYRGWYTGGDYAQRIGEKAGAITNLHLPPLGQLLGLAEGQVIVSVHTPGRAVVLFLALYVVLAAIAVGFALPARDRRPGVLAGAAVGLLLSYPALLMMTRGNFHSGFTSLGVLAFCLALWRRGTVGPWSTLALALAVNLRPNAAIFALALPLALGLRASLPHLARLAATAGAIAAGAFAVAARLLPEYRPATFLGALRIYGDLYVTGDHGATFNSSLLGLVKFVARVGDPAAAGMGASPALSWAIFNVTAVALVGAALLALRSGRLRPSSACFLLVLCYVLGTPTFGDYHLLVVVGPLLLLHLEAEDGEVAWDGAARALVIGATLLLAAKNEISWGGRSLQVAINPLVALWAFAAIARPALRGAPAPRLVEG
jgi:hypothetical protein